MPEVSPWMNRKQVAEYCGVSVKTIDKWATDGSGPPYRMPKNRMIRFRRDEVFAWMDRNVRRHTADDGTASAVLREAEALAKSKNWEP